jgi:hypothetical protein
VQKSHYLKTSGKCMSLAINLLLESDINSRTVIVVLHINRKTRPAWAGFKTAEEGIAIIMSCIL